VTLAYSPNAAALLTVVVAGLVTALVVPLVRRLGLRWGLVDAPDPRKQHTAPMVRLGGAGIVAGFGLALAITWLARGFADLPPDKDRLIWTTLAGHVTGLDCNLRRVAIHHTCKRGAIPAITVRIKRHNRVGFAF